MWNPLNTSDFSPYLGQIAGMNIDAVFAMQNGADATRLLQQYASFGLKDRIPLLGAMNLTDQAVIRTLGPECEGVISPAHFVEGADNPVTVKFVEDYGAKYRKIPSLFGFSMYSGSMWVSGAIEKIGGRVEDRDAFIDSVRKTELPDSPVGKPVRLDTYGNPIYDVYIRRVIKRPDGKYWNVPIETYPNVSQFWTYDPETYLKQPPYSRTFQGIKKT
jgi:branched-chain amino acid transport system substrate-binding protein